MYMLKLFAFTIHMSDGDKSFWGAIIGAAIGAVGAMLVATFAVILDRKSRTVQDDRNMLRRYNGAAVIAEAQVNQLITILLKNDRLLADQAKLTTPGNFMMNLPRTMPLDSRLIKDMQNTQLASEWLTYSIRVDIQNQITEDFNSLYSFLRDKVHERKLNKEPLDNAVVIQEFEDLSGFAASCLKVTRVLTQQSIEMLALLHLHGETKFVSRTEMKAKEFGTEEIETKTKELSPHYTVEKAFSNIGNNFDI